MQISEMKETSKANLGPLPFGYLLLLTRGGYQDCIKGISVEKGLQDRPLIWLVDTVDLYLRTVFCLYQGCMQS